jgi:hypothetical protein
MSQLVAFYIATVGTQANPLTVKICRPDHRVFVNVEIRPSTNPKPVPGAPQHRSNWASGNLHWRDHERQV